MAEAFCATGVRCVIPEGHKGITMLQTISCFLSVPRRISSVTPAQGDDWAEEHKRPCAPSIASYHDNLWSHIVFALMCLANCFYECVYSRCIMDAMVIHLHSSLCSCCDVVHLNPYLIIFFTTTLRVCVKLEDLFIGAVILHLGFLGDSVVYSSFS